MSIKHMAYTVTIFIASVTAAHAQLSYNPWEDPNDPETVSKYYEKLRKSEQENIEYYEPEAPTELDRTSAYLELPSEEDEDTGILSKVGNLFKSKEEPILVPNTEENRLMLQEMENEIPAEDSSSFLDSGSKALNNFGLNQIKESVKRKIPHISTDGIIHKFERASGVNFKSIARKIKM